MVGAGVPSSGNLKRRYGRSWRWENGLHGQIEIFRFTNIRRGPASQEVVQAFAKDTDLPALRLLEANIERPSELALFNQGDDLLATIDANQRQSRFNAHQGAVE
jgi:hypothetical protein